MNKLFAFLIGICSFINCFSQNFQAGEVSGTVIDKETQFGIPFASISIENKETKKITGGLTDDDGKFKVKSPYGSVTITISFMGYNTFKKDTVISKKNKSLNLKVILEPTESLIKEVTVSSKRNFIQNKIDKKVVDVSQLATAAGANASEVLETLPSVEIDIDGNVSLRGNTSVKVLVDGKPSGLSASETLQQIPADGIKTIEIITNPSAKI